MAEMGRYCKAYLAKVFADYPDWKPDLDALRQEEGWPRRTELADDDVVYLQENLWVTDGIFKDENVLFADSSDAWKTFCHETLAFEVPSDVHAMERAAEEAAAAARDESAETVGG